MFDPNSQVYIDQLTQQKSVQAKPWGKDAAKKECTTK